MPFDARPVRHAYEAIADEYANTFADDITANEFDRAVIDDAVADLGDDSVVADVGCGPGQVAAYLNRDGRWAVGLDLTPAMLAIARQRNRTLSLAGGDVFALPLRDSAVDGIVVVVLAAQPAPARPFPPRWRSWAEPSVPAESC